MKKNTGSHFEPVPVMTNSSKRSMKKNTGVHFEPVLVTVSPDCLPPPGRYSSWLCPSPGIRPPPGCRRPPGCHLPPGHRWV